MAMKSAALLFPVWNWLSAAPSDPGMKLAEAFNTFAALVNANPGNDCPLSIVKDHSHATGTTRFGFIWRLGHPVNPLLLRLLNSNVSQGSSINAYSQFVLIGREALFLDNGTNGGYGDFSATLKTAAAGVGYYGPAGSPAFNMAAFLAVFYDTAPGSEWFTWSFMPAEHDTYQNNLVMVLFRTPATTGWNVYVLRSRAYIADYGSEAVFIASGDTLETAYISPGTSGKEQILYRGLDMIIPQQNSPGLFQPNSIQQRVMLPSVLYQGANNLSDPRRLGRTSDPAGGGTFYELGAASDATPRDLWIRQPSGTGLAVPGWSAIGSMPWRSATTQLLLGWIQPRQPLLIGPAVAPDFVSDWPAMQTGLGGLQQHPWQSRQLTGSGGGGGGGAGRPSSGVLWPRGNG